MQHNAHIDMMHIIQYTVRLNGFMCTFNMHSYRRTCIREGKGRGGVVRLGFHDVIPALRNEGMKIQTVSLSEI